MLNSHLNQIFEEVLPAIEKAGIKYWVFGGVGLASLNGDFYRENDDIDIFVFESDYLKTLDVVDSVSKLFSWEPKDKPLVKGRPKREYYIAGKSKDVLSIVPVYPHENKVRFIFPETDDKVFSIQDINSQKRSISGYAFYSLQKSVLLDLLRHNLNYLYNSKSKKLLTRLDLRTKYEIDAKKFLTPEEVNHYFKIS